MFTGLIEELGRVIAVEPTAAGARLVVSASLVTSDISNGDSIAVNGVCLTALDVTPDSFTADVSPETLQRTTIGDLRPAFPVNLERAVTISTRLGGHMVQGHVDGRGTFLGVIDEGDFHTVTIGFPTELDRYLVEKGSVAVDGISLTIARLFEDSFEVAIIPKTWQVTSLSSHGPGDKVNLEVDIIAKYVEKLLPKPAK
ncbi:MAG: riboflavin synthase [Acidobacteria bacterium]|nr:riboflavin synthase [Acidobacteriota bacterium]